MATLIHPDDTGTLDRAAVEEAASRAPDRGATVTIEALDQQADELRAWLDAHGTVDAERPADADQSAPVAWDAAAFPVGVPPILVHQHVWAATPEAFHPTTSRSADLEELIDRALPSDEAFGGAPVTDSAGFTALPRSQDESYERELDRRRALGWASIIAVWVIAAALVVPLAIGSIVGAFDLTIDLSGTDEVVAEDAEQAPADLDEAEDGTDPELATS